MSDHTGIDINYIREIAPFSQGSTEIFLTGRWSNRKPVWVEKTSPCRAACPIGNDIPRAFYHASRGEYDEALRLYRQDNPLPGVCGRVCYHPCESSCNRKDFDQAVNIRGFERFLADHGKVDPEREAPARIRKERVAVLGSGPAGLSAAYHLRRLGYGVTIFEALTEPGGMLMYGIPGYRLPKDVLRAEIGYIKALGVEIKTGIRVGSDVSLASLQQDYQAIFLAIGAHAPTPLQVAGEDLPGVTDGISFLRSINSGENAAVGKKTVVIGGGNTAVDCARAARRGGCSDVTIMYRRSRAEMPALAEDIGAAEAEGIKILVLAAPVRFTAEGGRVSGIESIRMELGNPDKTGRPAPVPVAGSAFALPADTVISAVGQTPESAFAQEFGLTTGTGSIIEVQAGTPATGVQGIFAGGDGAGTRAFVADAIASGKTGALAIACYFEGKDMQTEMEAHRIGASSSFSFRAFMDTEGPRIDLKDIVTFDKVNTLCFPHGERTNNPEQVSLEDRHTTFNEVTGGIEPSRMPFEVYRCFKCGTCTRCDLCFLLCPDISIQKSANEGYTVRKDYCKGCTVCATTCPRNVIEIGDGT